MSTYDLAAMQHDDVQNEFADELDRDVDRAYGLLAAVRHSVLLAKNAEFVLERCIVYAAFALERRGDAVRACMLMPTMCDALPGLGGTRVDELTSGVRGVVADAFRVLGEPDPADDAALLSALYLVELAYVVHSETGRADAMFGRMVAAAAALPTACLARLARCCVLYAARRGGDDGGTLGAVRAAVARIPDPATRAYAERLVRIEEPAPAPPGLGDYDPGRIFKLGSGGYGDVFLVYRGGEPRALKRVAVRADTVSQIVRERNLLMLLRHPHIVRGHRLLVDEGVRVFIEMELATSGDAANALTMAMGTDSAKRRAYHVASQLIPAVQHMHSYGFVHCDIKPQNVMVFDGGRTLKLGDFGLCAKIGARNAGVHGMFGGGDPDAWWGAAGRGTIYAPELAFGNNGTARRTGLTPPEIDIWGVGDLMFAGDRAYDKADFLRLCAYVGGRTDAPAVGAPNAAHIYGSDDPELLGAIAAMMRAAGRSFAPMLAWCASKSADPSYTTFFVPKPDLVPADTRRVGALDALRVDRFDGLAGVVDVDKFAFDEARSELVELLDPGLRRELAAAM